MSSEECPIGCPIRGGCKWSSSYRLRRSIEVFQTVRTYSIENLLKVFLKKNLFGRCSLQLFCRNQRDFELGPMKSKHHLIVRLTCAATFTSCIRPLSLTVRIKLLLSGWPHSAILISPNPFNILPQHCSVGSSACCLLPGLVARVDRHLLLDCGLCFCLHG